MNRTTCAPHSNQPWSWNQPWNWSDARNRCFGLACRYASPDEAEDIAQEALLRAWRGQGALRRGDRAAAWLSSIVRNEAAREHARPRPEPVAQLAEDRGVDDERLVGAPERVDLHEALEHLDSRERLLLRLRYGEDLTQGAIGRLLRMPEGTVKVRLHRARRKLHRALSRA